MSGMATDPHHKTWTRVPLAAIGVYLVVTLIAVYDLTANGSQDAWTGIVIAPLGALAWIWVYRQIKRS
jgi:hypothetical protein